MDKRKLIGILIIFLGGLLLAGIVYFVFFSGFSVDDLFNKFKGKDAAPETIKQPSTEKPVKHIPKKSEVKKIIINKGEPTEEVVETQDFVSVRKDDLSRMAASFAERFGSYSNQSNFSNITDLKIFMSRRMQKWADDYIKEQRGKDLDNSIYYGVTTKATDQEIKDFDDDVGKAVILIKTRRREAVSTTNNTSDIFEQDIVVNFIKERGAWKVDSANWQD